MSTTVLLEQAVKAQKAKYPSGLSEDDAFELFCATNILKNYELSYDEVSDGIVDGPKDGGIDAAYVFVNGQIVEEDTDLSGFKKPVDIEIVIIQSKNQDTFKEAPIDKLAASLPMLLDFNQAPAMLENAFSGDVVSTFTRYRAAFGKLSGQFPKITIRCFYCSKGTTPGKACETKANALSAALQKLSGGNVTLKFVGAENLYELAREQGRYVASFPTVGSPLFGTDSFVALCRLADFAAFISDPSVNNRLITRLFEANVRAYQGDVEVNREIAESLSNPGSDIDFWWLNNGVTIVADKAQFQNGKMTIENPLIVNGLQTSYELHAFSQKKKDDKRSILVRVIQEKDAAKRDQIIKATNRQTSINASSLRATEEVHRRIEDFFLAHGLYYDRRKNFYKNEGKPADRIISMDKLAQATMSVLLKRPDDARARPTTLIKKDADYEKLFPAGASVKAHPLDMYRVLAEALARVEAYFKTATPKIDRKYKSNLKFHTLMVLLWDVTGSNRLPPKGVANINVSNIPTAVVEKSANWVRSQFDLAGATDQIAKDKAFTAQLVKNWKKP